MKKKILAIAILAVSALGATYAQDTNTTCTATEQCALNGKQAKRSCAFDGLNLTDAQKAKLGELRKESAKKRDADKKEAKEAKAEKRMFNKERRAERLAKIKEILTPEQYVKFLENSYLEGKQDFNKKARDMRKDGKKMSRSFAGEKQAQRAGK